MRVNTARFELLLTLNMLETNWLKKKIIKNFNEFRRAASTKYDKYDHMFAASSPPDAALPELKIGADRCARKTAALMLQKNGRSVTTRDHEPRVVI